MILQTKDYNMAISILDGRFVAEKMTVVTLSLDIKKLSKLVMR